LSYAKGRGIEQNISKALYWYKRAAANGEVSAQYNLAEHLRTDDGIEQDYKMSLFWFRKAAEKNYQSAQNNLGMMYAEGNGAKKDLVEASKWFYLAIANGSESAKVNLEKFEKEMTAEQIAEAKKAATQWLTIHRKCSSYGKQINSNPQFDADTPSACRLSWSLEARQNASIRPT
jgi:TPR repeat protein